MPDLPVLSPGLVRERVQPWSAWAWSGYWFQMFSRRSPKRSICGIFWEKAHTRQGFFLFMPKWHSVWLLSFPFHLLGSVLGLLNRLCCALSLDCWGFKWVFFRCLQEMCSEWPPQDLQAPHHAGGFGELLLHFTILQGQGESATFPGCLSPPKSVPKPQAEEPLGQGLGFVAEVEVAPHCWSPALPYVPSECSLSVARFRTGLWLFCFIIIFLILLCKTQ